MRASTAVLALTAATGAFAQIPAGLTQILGSLSSSCQQTVLQLATTSDLAQCMHVSQILPIVTTALNSSDSLIAPLDQILAIDCGQPGCSNATITSAVGNITAGCATDLAKYNVTNSTVKFVASQYPLAREIICLRTAQPYNATNVTIPITSPPYNISNNATYCVTSVLTEVSSLIGQNLTIPFFTSLYQSYMNGTIAQYAKFFHPTDICNDCIFAAADLIGVAYPSVGNVSLKAIGVNATIEQALDNTCAASGYQWTSNGTLPYTIRVSAVNSTFPYNVTAGSITYLPGPAQQPIRRNNLKAVKARWIGEQ